MPCLPRVLSQWSLPPPPLSALPSAVAVVAPCPHRSAVGAAGAPAPPARPAPTPAPGPGPATVEASCPGAASSGTARPLVRIRSGQPRAPPAVPGPPPSWARTRKRGSCARGIVGRAGPPSWAGCGAEGRCPHGGGVEGIAVRCLV